MEPVGELAAKPPSCHSVPTVPNGAESGDLIAKPSRRRPHKNIQHTVRYSELAPDRFKNFWR